MRGPSAQWIRRSYQLLSRSRNSPPSEFVSVRHWSIYCARWIQSHFLRIHFNIILPHTPRYFKWSPFLWFPHQNPLCAYPLPHTCYVPRSSNSSRFWSPENYFVIFSSVLFLERHQRRYSICSWRQFVVPNNRTFGVASCPSGSSVERRGYALSDHRVGTARGRGTHPALQGGSFFECRGSGRRYSLTAVWSKAKRGMQCSLRTAGPVHYPNISFVIFHEKNWQFPSLRVVTGQGP